MKKEATMSIINNGANLITTKFDIIKRGLSSVIELDTTDNGYRLLNKAIYHLNKEKYEENRYPSLNQYYYSLIDNTEYWITLRTKKDFIHVYAFSKPLTSQHETRYEVSSLRISIYGPNRKKIREKIYRYIIANKPDPGKVMIETWDTGKFQVNMTTFNNIILPKATQRYLISSLYHWYKDKKWYSDHNLVHKLGILLYGKPGTGKSTIIRAISGIFHQANIYILDIFSISRDLNDMRAMREMSNGVFIVVMEDIDLAFKSRDDEKHHKSDGLEQDKNQQIIFQLLDGILSMEDTIFIATTNHKERLDPALIRYGRFDVQIELQEFEEPDALKFLSMFGYKKDVLEEMNISYPITPSELQSKVLEYRAYH